MPFTRCKMQKNLFLFGWMLCHHDGDHSAVTQMIVNFWSKKNIKKNTQLRIETVRRHWRRDVIISSHFVKKRRNDVNVLSVVSSGAGAQNMCYNTQIKALEFDRRYLSEIYIVILGKNLVIFLIWNYTVLAVNCFDKKNTLFLLNWKK